MDPAAKSFSIRRLILIVMGTYLAMTEGTERAARLHFWHGFLIFVTEGLPQDRAVMTETLNWVIRPGHDSDGPGIIGLIDSCWSHYPGIHMDVDGEMPELHALATYYRQHSGALWVAEDGHRITGMIATRPLESVTWEICRVYVAPSLHGSGLGHALLDHAEHHAVTVGAKRLVLWSDTRFDRAHRFYEKRSYLRHGPVRVLNDISNSLEFGYAKPVNGVELLDIAGATAAETRLTDVLVACTEKPTRRRTSCPLPPWARHALSGTRWPPISAPAGASWSQVGRTAY
jgi:GNAT superfamily N-acetyltransferase